MTTKSTGQTGENIAAEYLKKQGFGIIGRNIRQKGGEIDIICRDTDGALVFVEVKTLSGTGDAATGLMPEDHMTSAKLRRVRRTCELLLAKHPDWPRPGGEWRIDLVAIDLGGASPAIRHYRSV